MHPIFVTRNINLAVVRFSQLIEYVIAQTADLKGKLIRSDSQFQLIYCIILNLLYNQKELRDISILDDMVMLFQATIVFHIRIFTLVKAYERLRVKNV